jgi:hypothetical protein
MRRLFGALVLIVVNLSSRLLLLDTITQLHNTGIFLLNNIVLHLNSITKFINGSISFRDTAVLSFNPTENILFLNHCTMHLNSASKAIGRRRILEEEDFSTDLVSAAATR